MNRKLFFNVADDIGRHQFTNRIEHAIAVSLRGRHRVNFHCRKVFHGADTSDPVAHSLAEDLTDIGGRIGTDQKRSPAPVSQPYRRRAGQRGFPHAAFAGEEDKRGDIL